MQTPFLAAADLYLAHAGIGTWKSFVFLNPFRFHKDSDSITLWYAWPPPGFSLPCLPVILVLPGPQVTLSAGLYVLTQGPVLLVSQMGSWSDTSGGQSSATARAGPVCSRGADKAQLGSGATSPSDRTELFLSPPMVAVTLRPPPPLAVDMTQYLSCLSLPVSSRHFLPHLLPISPFIHFLSFPSAISSLSLLTISWLSSPLPLLPSATSSLSLGPLQELPVPRAWTLGFLVLT